MQGLQQVLKARGGCGGPGTSSGHLHSPPKISPPPSLTPPAAFQPGSAQLSPSVPSPSSSALRPPFPSPLRTRAPRGPLEGAGGRGRCQEPEGAEQEKPEHLWSWGQEGARGERWAQGAAAGRPPASLGTRGHGGDIRSHRLNACPAKGTTPRGMSPALSRAGSDPPSTTPPLTVPRGAAVPIHPLQHPAPASRLRHRRPDVAPVALRAPGSSNLRRAAGTRGPRGAGVAWGAPSWPLPSPWCPCHRHRPCAGSVPAAPRRRGPSVPAPMAVPSLPAPSPSLPAFSSLIFFSFFSPKTPPRGTHGEEEAQFPIVSIFLFIVLLGKNTALPANKRAFIRRPQSRGIQGKMSAPRRAPQPLLRAETPPGHQSPLGTLLPASRIKFLPPHSEFPALRCHPAGLLWLGSPLPPQKPPERLPCCHLGAGNKAGGHNGAVCWAPPLSAPPALGPAPGGDEARGKRRARQVAVCPRRTQRSRPHMAQKTTLLGGVSTVCPLPGSL